MRRVLALCVCLLLFTACYKPYVGRKLNYYTDYWCRCETLPAKCKIGGGKDQFTFEFTVDKIGEEYCIEGAAHWPEASGMITIKEISASIILANDKTVTDYIPFGIFAKDLREPLPFKKTFKTEKFDAVTINYRMWIHD